jgi:hypothetical protein
MAVLWKAWKAKSRLPPLPTSPLEIPPKTGGIPTFPQCRRRRRLEKWKTKCRFPTFPPPRFPLSNQATTTAGAASPLRRGTPPHIRRYTQLNERKPSEATFPIQAHRLLESTCLFRLISLWNQFLISGSFLDWKMLGHASAPFDGGGGILRGKGRVCGRLRSR